MSVPTASDSERIISGPAMLVDALSRPSAYPHPCQSIRVIETHISWVFLTGEFAYKLKKPVDFGFVNFSSVALRHFYCEEELRLNRRLAPDLYLSVLPVTHGADGVRVGGMGSAVDHVVCMRQFDQRKLLSHYPDILNSRESVEDLADRLAGFHRHATPAPQASRFGDPEEVMQSVRDNFSVLLQAITNTDCCVKHLQQDAESEYQRLQPVLAARKQSGMVRECHGDLHLGNMFVEDHQITVFDGIEFNDDLRWIDIISDLAFMVMDLQDRGFDVAARRLLNRWLEMTGDYEGPALLPFYCAYRANVRAKVDVVRMQQPGVTLSHQRHLCSDCTAYLRLAGRYAVRHRPALVITTGPSGSGKSRAAQQLTEAADVIRIRSDVERKRLHGLEAAEQSGGVQKTRLYSADSTAATYERLEQLAQTIIESGFPVVVDAAFLKHEQRLKFRRLADRLCVPFLILDFTTDVNPEVLRDRIARRRSSARPDASEADEQVLQQQLDHRDLLSPSELDQAVSSRETNVTAVTLERLGQ
ncbi:MAG: AAA family ATPase [Planctomycetaceae bacterium]|nr:AAA family ATPase [Planctomycetaceae bacterium]